MRLPRKRRNIRWKTLPVETLVYLLGSRYCETDRLTNSHGPGSATSPRDGLWFRRSATMSTIAYVRL